MSVSRAGSPVLAHDDRAVAVAVAAMLLHDIDSLARWVSAVLGPLAANTRNAERRETLLAFPASGGTSSRPTGCSCTTTPSSTGSPALWRCVAGVSATTPLDVELALEVVRLLGDVVLR